VSPPTVRLVAEVRLVEPDQPDRTWLRLSSRGSIRTPVDDVTVRCPELADGDESSREHDDVHEGRPDSTLVARVALRTSRIDDRFTPSTGVRLSRRRDGTVRGDDRRGPRHRRGRSSAGFRDRPASTVPRPAGSGGSTFDQFRRVLDPFLR
jgi:hypothetical protein